MNKVFLSIIGIFLILAFGLLVYASQSGTTQVFTPSELVNSKSKPTRLRLVGRVLADTINYQIKPSFNLEFFVGDPKGDSDAKIKVAYQGIKPDMFQAGRDVIIDGEYISKENVKAATLLTQCPSKYEAPEINESNFK